jgi:hypothetical protein
MNANMMDTKKQPVIAVALGDLNAVLDSLGEHLRLHIDKIGPVLSSDKAKPTPSTAPNPANTGVPLADSIYLSAAQAKNLLQLMVIVTDRVEL